MTRRACKVDANHVGVVNALRYAGANVLSLAAMGGGVPDLLVKYRGVLFLLECKDGAKPPSHRTLTQDQKDWIAAWGGGVHVVLSADDALKAIGAIA